MRNMRIAGLLATVIGVLPASLATGQEASDDQIPARKQTELGLYATARQAYEMWAAAPEEVTILDIRTPEEFIFVGHPAMAWNIPFAVQTYEWDAERGYFAMKPDPSFVSRVEALFSPDDTLMVMCRSGDRGAIAVNLLAKAGFTNAYNVVDGMEGDLVEDPGRADFGKRTENGWKNSGAPWTYDIERELIKLPDRE